MDRPTFHESWYRVAELKPRLRAVVQVYRQDYRGQAWHVLRDPGNNQFFRVDESAYRLVALLDGERTVGEAWKLVGEQLGDAAPTQGEAIQLLGQLYTSNLLTAELPPDAEGMFDRYKRRINRQVGGYLMNIMFAKIPLLDPDRFLDRWKPAVSWVFGPVGIALWCVLLFAGGWHLAGRTGDLFDSAGNVLDPSNLLYLYGGFVLAKVIHELGHGFAVKRFGDSEGTASEVHTVGVMLLVLMPVPYVDASSSWAFRSKARRAFVAAAGMYVELALAAIAAIVWAQTSEGAAIHALAYNVMFIASVSTILFNANPLIRFDGYYILSDLTETPNLYKRANDYLKYLVKKYVYRVRNPRSSAHRPAERWWLSAYGCCSLVYRVFLFAGILWFVADKLFFVGIIMAGVSIIAWVFVPLGKWIKYLVLDAEVERTRGWAQFSSLAFVALVVGGLGYVPVPDHARATGLVEPVVFEPVYAGADGFVTEVAERRAVETGSRLYASDNVELRSERDALDARLRRLEAEWRKARMEGVAESRMVDDQIIALGQRLERVQRDLTRLERDAERQATWVPRSASRQVGRFIPRGEGLGVLASLDETIIRAAADQYLGPQLDDAAADAQRVEIKAAGRAGVTYSGVIERINPAGSEQLPSAALGYAAGGPVATDPSDPEGTKAMENFFEVRIRPSDLPEGAPPLVAGQRVTVRFRFEDKPLLQQGWLELRRLFQKRFGV
ncbi:MAG: PqqD family peptide modification chaperone [Planctomycetota bacterium]